MPRKNNTAKARALNPEEPALCRTGHPVFLASFIRPSEIVYSFSLSSTSDHVAPRTSPERHAVRIVNSGACCDPFALNELCNLIFRPSKAR
jgi:hypothetical protein